MNIQVKSGLNLGIPDVSRTTKLIAISIGTGVVILSFIGGYISRRSRRRNVSRPTSWRHRHFAYQFQALPGLNGEIPQLRSVPAPLCVKCRSLQRNNSSAHASRTVPLDGGTTVDYHGVSDNLSAQELGVMGMEALDTAISYWEDSLVSLRSVSHSSKAIPSPQEAAFVKDLNRVIGEAYKLRDLCGQLFLDEKSYIFQAEEQKALQDGAMVDQQGVQVNGGGGFHKAGSSSLTGGIAYPSRSRVASVDSDSFVSATDASDVANLYDLETPVDIETLALYQAALKHLKSDGIPSRGIRTQLLHCASDDEYLAKLHCVRLAFQHLIAQSEIRDVFVEAGNQILGGLMMYAEKDPKECLAAYEQLINFCINPANHATMEIELKARGVPCLTIYDVLIDFVLMEAFEDLDDPPASVVAVVQNRWLSAGFRETALGTAIWSIVKAKRSRVKVENGFFHHYYSVAEHLSPVLAWGFLGTNDELKDVCNAFKDEVVALMKELFDFRKTRYTSVSEMAEDIYNNAQMSFDKICQRLAL